MTTQPPTSGENPMVPTSSREVDELVATLPPQKEVESQIKKLKKTTRPMVLKPGEPRLWFAIALCLFLAVILLAQIQAISERSSLKAQLADASDTSECRDAITGDLNIAKAEGILAGNEAILLLLNVLHDVVVREPVNDADFQADTARITAADLAAAEHARIAIDSQRNVLTICRE